MSSQIRRKIYIKFFLLTLLVVFNPLFSAAQSYQPGDIIITEFMANPDAVSDDNGEYIELYNRRSVAININGFTLSDNDSDSHTIDNGGSLTIPGEDFIVLARSSNPGLSEAPEYVFDGFSLSNSGDEIILSDPENTQIARIEYMDNIGSSGVSAVLDDIKGADGSGEIASSEFQVSENNIGNGDKGSPGQKGITSMSEAPTVRFLSEQSTTSEGDDTASISVLLEDPDGTQVEVDVLLQTEESSVVAGDFTGATTKTVTFPASSDDGDTQQVIFSINDDSEYEGTETAIFKLTNVTTSGSASLASPDMHELTINDNDQPDVVVNEILADPDGDANGDGKVDTDSDEFIEIVNNEAVSIDLSNWTLSDADGIIHTFAQGTVLKANEAVVVFDGSGAPQGSFGGSVVVQSTEDLSLNNSGDTITLDSGGGNSTIDMISYGGAGEPDASNESLVRNPDGVGTFTRHTTADTDDNSPFSPGTKIDGSNFTNSVTIEGTAGWRMLSSPVDGMEISDIASATAIQGYPGYNDGFDENFYVGYDDATDTFTKADDINGKLENGKGFLLYFFNNDQAGSTDLPVTLTAPSGSIHTGDVSVSLSDGWNLLGNPFETAVNINDMVVNDGSLINKVGQIWDHETGSYITTSTTGGKVAAWQGFFIENSDATSVEFPQSSKTSGTQFYKERGDAGYLALTLRGEHHSEEVETTDKAAVLYFHEQATHEQDAYDATKLVPLSNRYALIGFSTGAQGGSGLGTELKAQESRPFDFEGELSVDLQMMTKEMEGSFELSWDKKDLPEEWSFTLIDNVTGDQVDMNTNTSYSFTFTERDKVQTTSEESAPRRSLPTAAVLKSKRDQKPRFTLKTSAPDSRRNTESNEIPESVKLNPNYPNPFNPSTTISFELTEQAHVNLNVYTIVGQKVATLVDEVRDVGEHTESWNAADMPSGIYIAQLEVQGKVYIRKMTLIK
ncbi:lamin tail domain-containing protein [Aliifodinibius sp. S!AR15-10]|uniref:lamin tail domain-containing protein n=1 Tax=Aliifodinibius sp. S!AR15-10 TaxID=2950437 RepID=UPI00285AF1C0|nr:lamin tail domain-containing protein [Aliifodinibius sp. S!AR15-10]MDR8391799.1 lamin tail domain-containing protein [Aliifodinibius sp. S!AR15-10]